MIHDLGTALQTKLAAEGCPFKVVDREQFDATSIARQRVVIEYDRAARHKWAAPLRLSGNPKVYFNVSPPCKITIYAQSTRQGATSFEHDDLALDAAFAVSNALRELFAERGLGLFMPSDAGFVTPSDLEGGKRTAGAVYEIKFSFTAAVQKLTWAGADLDEFTVGAGSITSSTKVSRFRGADDDGDDTTVPAAAETACGA